MKKYIAILLLAFSGSVYAADGIELSEYIEHLRSEFIKIKNGTGKEQLPLFISAVEVELKTVTVKEATAGVKVYVFEAGGKYQDSATQHLSSRLA